MEIKCHFCARAKEKPEHMFLESDNFAVLWDLAPVSKGHCVIFPKSHVDRLRDLNFNLGSELLEFRSSVEKIINDIYHPDGYNFGVNDGEAAGRSINHLHFHLIPRYNGDIDNPRGGIRNIMGGSISPKSAPPGFR